MKLDKIITLANKVSELRFLAMVRSLRSTGCDLPILVIPYDDGEKIDLPENCSWWEIDELLDVLRTNMLHPMMRKFQCLLTENYQFVDADIVFLKNPELTLQDFNGFVTSCCHWNNPEHTYIQETKELFKSQSTTWRKDVFNAGQFACDEALYNLATLKAEILNPINKQALAIKHDQIALNLFRFLSGKKITNITLPPYNVESTWAGDYTDANYLTYWKDEFKKPYLIHWVGCKMNDDRPIDKLFLQYLTTDEKTRWFDSLKDKPITIKDRLRRIKKIIKRIILNK